MGHIDNVCMLQCWIRNDNDDLWNSISNSH